MKRIGWRAQWWRVASGLVLLGAVAAAQAQRSDHTLMRYPTLHGDTIVFAAHDNLWSVPRTGGVASRLTTDHTPRTLTQKCITVRPGSSQGGVAWAELPPE